MVKNMWLVHCNMKIMTQYTKKSVSLGQKTYIEQKLKKNEKPKNPGGFFWVLLTTQGFCKP